MKRKLTKVPRKQSVALKSKPVLRKTLRKNRTWHFTYYCMLLFLSSKRSFCLCDLYRSRNFGFVGFCQHEELFFNYCKWNYGRYGRTYWKIPGEPQADIYFKLGVYQPFRGMVPILVWDKNVRLVFNLLSSFSLLCPVGWLLKELITVSFY